MTPWIPPSGTPTGFRAGLGVVLGRANVGKSTLINAWVGEKVSIVSPKPHTTRHRIQGVVHTPNAQLILVDTPGLGRERGVLGRLLHRTAGCAAAEADVVVVVVDVQGRHPPKQMDPVDIQVMHAARSSGAAVVLALNKMDRLACKEELLPWIAAYAQGYGVDSVVPVSALRKQGLEDLFGEVVRHLPQGDAWFPPTWYTDQTERFLCAELIREQMMIQTHEEIPYSAAVVLEDFEDLRDTPRNLCCFSARIYVERDSQKGMVIGKGGHRIKALGQAARPGIEALLGCRVFFHLSAHVDPHWTTSDQALRRYGLMPP